MTERFPTFTKEKPKRNGCLNNLLAVGLLSLTILFSRPGSPEQQALQNNAAEGFSDNDNFGRFLPQMDNPLTIPLDEQVNNSVYIEPSSQESVEQKEIEVILTGDIMLGRTTATESLENQNDPRYPFLKVGQTLENADLTFVNLENPVIDPCPRHTGGFTLCAPPNMLEGLVYSGVDVATIANNHILDYGKEGRNQTVNYLENNGIEATGIDNLVIKEVGGVKFGFLGFDLVNKHLTQEQYELVSRSDKEVDVLIAGVHWGYEYVDHASYYQKEMARKFIENGVDVLVGHHPHWVQNNEYINGKPVYYSLGNFVFDQMWSIDTRSGLAIRLTFDANGNLMKEDKLPVFIDAWAQPRWNLPQLPDILQNMQ